MFLYKKSKPIIFLIIMSLIYLPWVHAEDSVSSKQEADKNVLGANQLVIRADKLKDEQKWNEAISHYVAAGQLLERAANAYRRLVPSHASEQDVVNAAKAMSYCISMAKELKQKLVAGPQKKGQSKNKEDSGKVLDRGLRQQPWWLNW